MLLSGPDPGHHHDGNSILSNCNAIVIVGCSVDTVSLHFRSFVVGKKDFPKNGNRFAVWCAYAIAALSRNGSFDIHTV